MSPAANIGRPRPDTRRAELVGAAQRVIERGGFSAATVGEITREAGASLGLLNYHFGSKDEVLAEAFDAFARDDLHELEEIAQRPEPAPERLAAYLESSEWADSGSWRLWLDAWGGAVRTEALRDVLERFLDGWRAALSEVLRDGVEEGCWACADPSDTAARLVAVIDGIGLHTTLHPGEVPTDRATSWARRLAELELGVALPGPPAPRPLLADSGGYAVRLPLRTRDLDPDGRVHPAVHVAFLEEARAGWLAARRADGAPSTPLVVARIAMELRGALTPADGEVLVRCAAERAGQHSIRTRETIETAAGAVVVSAGTTLIALDAGGRPRALTAAEREALTR